MSVFVGCHFAPSLSDKVRQRRHPIHDVRGVAHDDCEEGRRRSADPCRSSARTTGSAAVLDGSGPSSMTLTDHRSWLSLHAMDDRREQRQALHCHRLPPPTPSAAAPNAQCDHRKSPRMRMCYHRFHHDATVGDQLILVITSRRWNGHAYPGGKVKDLGGVVWRTSIGLLF